ncbi:osm1, partial [Symbiodinium sp. CCMP2456]
MACSFPTNQAIVVGGGLGGMSAANTVVEHGGRVVLLDKSSFCGGNSTKATSGINGAGTKTQKAKGIPDNAEIFTQDTLKGGAKKPELAKLLCVNSADDVDWLVDKFNLDLSLVARLGGHSQPRTHRGKERFPGMTITYALIQMLEKVAEKTDLARIITKAKVFKLVTDKNACVGCVYEKGGQNFQEFGPVSLAIRLPFVPEMGGKWRASSKVLVDAELAWRSSRPVVGMTGAPKQDSLAASRDSLFARHPRTQRTIAGLVSITPEPPLPALPLLERKMICPPEPFKRSAPANTQAYLRREAGGPDFAVASEGSPEAPSGVMSPAHAPGNSPSIELAWRVVHAAETRKAALLEQRAYALRVRRTIPAPSSLNTTFPSQKSVSMSPHFRDLDRNGENGSLRPPLPYGASSPLTPPA